MDFLDDFGDITDESAIHLIFALFDELPELFAEIAPDGWNKSIYRHPIRRFNLNSHIFRSSKNHKVISYNFHKRNHPGIPYKSSNELKPFKDREPFPDAVHYKATILFYLCTILSDLSSDANMIHVASGEVRIFEYYHICRLLPKVLSEHNLWPQDKLERIQILVIYDANLEEDSTPFYKAAFRALKKMGYKWSYFDSRFASIVYNLFEYHQIKWSPTQKNIDGLTASKLLALNKSKMKYFNLKYSDPLDEQEICDAFNSLPPCNSVLAYLEVHNQLPQNYPLSVSYYRSLFDNF